MSQANELGLYSLFTAILNQSMVIGGRFAVLSSSLGIDMNVTNFNQVVKDAMGGFSEKKKYPCALLLPPYETESRDEKGWSSYMCQMYFLTLNNVTGDGDVKTPDPITQLSNHTYQQDWKDMREVSGSFREMLHRVLMGNKDLLAQIRPKPHATDQYHRVKGMGNDNANGIHLSFAMQVYNGYNCGELVDYPDPASIVIPDFNPHPLHVQ